MWKSASGRVGCFGCRDSRLGPKIGRIGSPTPIFQNPADTEARRTAGRATKD